MTQEAGMMKRVLFVDDDSNVLQGLRRTLRGMRHEWEMRFVEEGREALRILSEGPYDVVVSDMRMPGMDGAELLEEVMRRHPHIVRIILSGHSDHELIMKSVRPAHQYLSKPCDAETLKSAVSRAFALRDLLTNESLKQAVSRIDALPSLPSLYQEIVAELKSSDSSLQKVGEIISKDVGMTAKILQLVNSAFFGLPRQVANPGQACALLGLDTIDALVLEVQIFSQFRGGCLSDADLDRIFNHCIATGIVAKSIANEEATESSVADDSFIAGLLHDVGKLVFAANLQESYQEALRLVEENEIPLYEAEKEVFGTTHAEVGAYLMGLWGLGDSIVEAIAFHHTPMKCPGVGLSPLLTVHVGNALEHMASNDTTGDMAERVDEQYLEGIDMLDHLPKWESISHKSYMRE
jgi:HD-like signal output (HDOD) protein